MNKIIKEACAKINLYLDVLSKYKDGYHEVNTVMQTVSLCDDVSVEIFQSDVRSIIVSSDVAGIPTDNRNIAWRAAELFLDKIDTTENYTVKIDITKRIPVSAGLGGGSSDAAAVICGLNELLGNRLSLEEMLILGASLGADVPFCIKGGCVFADGKGDSLYTLKNLPQSYVVVARGGEGASTPWAYGMLDKKFNDFADGKYIPYNKKDLVAALENGDLGEIGNNLYNVFELAIFPERPTAAILKNMLVEGGAIGAIMSGSGTAVFGIFDNESRAKESCDRINTLGHFACVSTPV